MSKKPTYEELETRVKELESVFQHALGAIITLDPSHRVLDWNPGAQKIFGYSCQEAIGKDLDDLITSPEVEQAAKKNTRKVLSGQPLKPVEAVRYRKDGTLVHVIVSGAPINVDNVLKGVVALYTDISDRKQAKDKLIKSEQRFRDLFNSINDVIYTQDFNGYFTSVNPALCKAFGYEKNELIGRRSSDFMKPEFMPAFTSEYLEPLKKKGYQEGRAIYYKKNGEKLYLEYKSALVQPEDGEPFISGTGRDITEKILSERKVAKLHEQVVHSQKMESIGTLASGIAHDFNNILSPIMGHTEILLMDAPEGSPSRGSLKEIYTATLRAKNLVKQILTFSRQEKSALVLTMMAPIVKEALKLIRSTIPATIDIKQDINPDCCVIKADPTQIHQIVMNLTTNAYQAMEETGGELKVSLKEMKLGKLDLINPAMQTGIYACLTVADTGMGMDKNLTNKIFDPFFTTKAPGKGTGMGLSVVHGIVTAMGGAIKVYSELEKGTKFQVYLPVEKSLSEKRVLD